MNDWTLVAMMVLRYSPRPILCARQNCRPWTRPSQIGSFVEWPPCAKSIAATNSWRVDSNEHHNRSLTGNSARRRSRRTMASERQIIANRANALKSRGPRSAAGKARVSRNAIHHGLAANIWREASAVSSIEDLMQLFRAGGYSEYKARLAAIAEYQTRSIRNVRSRIVKQLCEGAVGRGPEGSLAKDLIRLQRIDRYEQRITSRKRRVFQHMQREI
jgi:hypothetical protein